MGGIPQGLPAFSVPHFDVDKILTLIGPAFTIAMLGAIESLLSAVVADGMSGTKHESNTELFGELPPCRILVAVRAIAPVDAIPPNKGAKILANPCPNSSVLFTLLH